jgi:WD40 repeat protein
VRSMRGDTYRLGEYRGEVTSISFIGDTEHIVTSSGDRSVRMHRTSSERDVRAFREGVSFMHASVATRDGRLVIGGGRDGVLHVWNGVNGYAVKAFPPSSPAAAR